MPSLGKSWTCSPSKFPIPRGNEHQDRHRLSHSPQRSDHRNASRIQARGRPNATAPVQIRGTSIQQVFSPPALESPELAGSAILLCDSNTVHGEIARLAIRELSARYPDAPILFASAVLDASCPALERVERTFFGRHSNESRRLSHQEAGSRLITNDIYVFPMGGHRRAVCQIHAAEPES